MLLNEIYDIQVACMLLISDKISADKYVDLADFGIKGLKRIEAYRELSQMNSKYAVLYEKPFKDQFPTVEILIRDFVVADVWQKSIGSKRSDVISTMEAKYIVSWVNYAMGKKFETNKASFPVWKSIIFNLSWSIDPEVYPGTFIIYDKYAVEISMCGSVTSFLDVIYRYAGSVPNKTFFYRGHSRINYLLLPSIMRKDTKTGKYELLKKEKQLYNEIQYRCSREFENCATHLEKLTIMQHYGIPTRLLDVTTNPLVALYFACCSKDSEDKIGEVAILCEDNEKIKWPESDTISILASIPTLSYEDNAYVGRAISKIIKNDIFNLKPSAKEYQEYEKRLVGEVRTEKPGFES